ncbi:RNA ligase family protein [Tuwongella immobilis]|uniref:RNA ligase family protein n=1 Tax=Tuwongella immobilis TaxID=692036 RepID=UPI001E361CAA|nr:RNA ligase family protein [Tuwongella immobilis]
MIEEKVDGANAAIRFNSNGDLFLQSRGHYLVGGANERQWDRFKAWAAMMRGDLWDVLGDRYVMYGEWLYAKHTMFYDALPHYFLEFDILDTHENQFLSTARRRQLCELLELESVPVLWEGIFQSRRAALSLIGRSRYQSANWRDSLIRIAETRRLDPQQILHETDASDLAEGLYLKLEENGIVVDRYKYVRADFLQCILDSGSHWKNRPLFPNQILGESHELV